MRLHILTKVLPLLLWQALLVHGQTPTAYNSECKVTYKGVLKDGVETFYAIPYAQDTGGANRFKRPQPYVPTPGSTFIADNAGPECPQQPGASFKPLYLTNVTETSEDCLHVNVYRAAGTAAGDKLPVMVYVHGGSFIIGSKDELTIQPGGLIVHAKAQGQPVVVVNINYRLGGKTILYQMKSLLLTFASIRVCTIRRIDGGRLYKHGIERSTNGYRMGTRQCRLLWWRSIADRDLRPILWRLEIALIHVKYVC